MNSLEQKIDDKEAIANWEDEGGALKFQPIIKKNNTAILIGIAILIILPFFLLAGRKMKM